jgi:hypothetical protein
MHLARGGVYSSKLYAVLRPTVVSPGMPAGTALASAHGMERISTDGDFARFTEIRWRNALTQEG